MTESVNVVDYYYAVVGDRPGEARRLLEHLSENEVNLVAFTAFPVGGGKTQVDFVTRDVDQLRSAASDAGSELVGPKQALLIQGSDRIGALYGHHLKLANANINVHASNGVVAGSGRYGYILWVAQDKVKAALEALKAAETEGRFGAVSPGGADW
jgi:hypothetical protein